MAPESSIDLAALGEDFSRDPYPVYAELRSRGPVHRVRTPEGGEAWLVVGHEAARQALAAPGLSKDWRNASEAMSVSNFVASTHMLNSDPPNHTRLRKLVTREFTPRRVASLAPRVRELTDGLLAEMSAAPDGRADLVDSLAFPLPMAVICELLGVPFLDRDSFRRWSNEAVACNDPVRREAAAAASLGYLEWLLEEKRRRPGEDLLSALIRTRDEEGDRLSREELLGTVWLLLVAGHETTVNLIANGVLALLRHPEQLAALRADLSLIDRAVEEMLRYDGPVETPTYRFATEPVEIGGTVIPGGGELVLVALADANRDPGRFPEPDRFDIHRPPGGHIAFGHGIHFCLGAALARLEARTAIRGLLEHCPELALDAHPASLIWHEGMLIRGPRRLPVRFGTRPPVLADRSVSTTAV
ncbi:cytochrome P450 family protein [Streptomyces sp. TP-A0874]|uniref:cytochrome P450 family protein n=1 Tax=Streptomyces sp. TP-A0874 TaxID=549819 RepID=UPI0008536E17|nr:cytochrome P450 [Streptomyces sp. TP-A0874]